MKRNKPQPAFSLGELKAVMLLGVLALLLSGGIATVYRGYAQQLVLDLLAERAVQVYEEVQRTIDPASHQEISSPADMTSSLYQDSLQQLLLLKNAAGLQYLYSVKQGQQGQYVYVLDGLESHLDFRYPNDPVETALQAPLSLAFQGQQLLPADILATGRGNNSYFAAFPLQIEQGEVSLVLAMEFDSTDSHWATAVPLPTTLALATVLFALFFGIYSLCRGIHPLYGHKSQYDVLTAMKNRSALKKACQKCLSRGKEGEMGMVVMEINGLKEVNHRLGHSAGDLYIRLVANSIHSQKTKQMSAFRREGDQFVLLCPQATIELLDRLVRKCSAEVKNQKYHSEMRCSITCGFALFDPNRDQSLKDTFHRAEQLMFQEKQRQIEKQLR